MVAYVSGGGTLTVNGVTSVIGNPTSLAGVAAGDQSIKVMSAVGTAFAFVMSR